MVYIKLETENTSQSDPMSDS